MQKKHWNGKSYKDLKDDVAKVYSSNPKKYQKIYNSNELEEWLENGTNKSKYLANKKLNKVSNLMGLVIKEKNQF